MPLMTEYLRFRKKLKKLFRDLEQHRSVYTEVISRAKKSKDWHEAQSLQAEEYVERCILEEEISMTVTNHWKKKAQRRFVPIPSLEDEDMWEKCEKASYEYVLTNRGISVLRSGLRTERKEQVELWLTVMAATTGVLGAITGFAAVVLR